MKALGNRVIIKPDDVETVSEGGIVFAQTDKFIRNERAETTTGVVVDFGPAAWLDPIMGGEPWVEIGDRVIYSKYACKYITNPDDNEEYVVMNDDAIQVRIK